ncbi:unnamed protein product [Heligmosomoides polygyrus]|uniref:Secreted protein n=1 Tax=Heligmosomoides polygyrus TaxID=6339 RepID=A0A183F7I2_HELPZ|nr:unnamed protein product [Heligmosomoides polygyrus]
MKKKNEERTRGGAIAMTFLAASALIRSELLKKCRCEGRNRIAWPVWQTTDRQAAVKHPLIGPSVAVVSMLDY